MFNRDVQTLRRELERPHAQWRIFDKIWGVWLTKSYETLSQEFDLSSQSKQKLRSKEKIKSSKSMLIKTRYPNLLYSIERGINY